MKRCSTCGFLQAAHPTYDTFCFRCEMHNVEIGEDELDNKTCDNHT